MSIAIGSIQSTPEFIPSEIEKGVASSVIQPEQLQPSSITYLVLDRIIHQTRIYVSPPTIDPEAAAHYLYEDTMTLRPFKWTCGPAVWPDLGKTWNCALEILDSIPNPPEQDVAKGTLRTYIPRKVSVNGVEKDFTLKTLSTMGCPFKFCDSSVINQFGDSTASGWKEIDMRVIPESLSKCYNTQKKMVEKTGCCMPSILEAIVHYQMLLFIGEQWPRSTYTRCFEKMKANPVVVGISSTDEGLIVRYSSRRTRDYYGVVAVRQF